MASLSETEGIQLHYNYVGTAIGRKGQPCLLMAERPHPFFYGRYSYTDIYADTDISATEVRAISIQISIQALQLEGTVRPFGGQKANPSTTEGKQVAGKVSLAFWPPVSSVHLEGTARPFGG
jgi:hypothetical protein